MLFGILQGILIISFFTYKRLISDHKYLVYFIAVIIFVQLHSFLIQSEAIFNVLILFNTNIPFILLFGPLLFLYSKSLLGAPVSISQRLLHFLPFIFYFGYSFTFFLQDPAFKFNILNSMLQLDLPSIPFNESTVFDPWNIQGWVVVEILSLHLVAYGCLSLFNLKNQNALESGIDRLLWLKFLNGILIIVGVILFLSEGGVVNGKVLFNSPFPKFSTDLFGTFVMYATTLYLLIKPEFIKSQTAKYSKSALSEEFMKSKMVFIRSVIENDKLFTDPAFSLDLLAQKTSLSKNHISQIINSELNCNFFDLTNQYRIEEAKRILKEPEFLKMEQLAYQLGYKSKSAFFNAFKRATTLTPSKYRES
jgi:AraC-like DNA-binding protein